MNFVVHHGDCLAVMRTMPDSSVDSIVTDPPYGLSFMGKRWDYDVPAVEVWAECLRVLKPGGHLLAFAGTRTQHRMAVRIEDAGFEIRDMIAWVYGSGFPKSHNLTGDRQGWGTALKPALEPITVARKPLTGTVAANVLAHGTGALNIDACRVATDENLSGGAYAENGRQSVSNSLRQGGGMNVIGASAGEYSQPSGRWPANLIHDGSEEVLACFPQSQGGAFPKTVVRSNRGGEFCQRFGDEQREDRKEMADAGSAARFFYCAKASRKDRNEGCEGMERLMPRGSNGAVNAVSENRGSRSGPRENHHPTVKPTDLMRYLCLLVTPRGGTVLDPFTGSGSTGKAAVLEGFKFIGIEREAEYVEIARARITLLGRGGDIPQGDLFGVDA